MTEMKALKQGLITMLRQKSYRHSDNPPFTLASGRKSCYYFNCKPTYLNPEGKELIGRMIFQLIKGQGIIAIGGLELGSVPISGAVSLISQLEGEPITDFIVRKAKKDHGEISDIEGEVESGQRVVIVDDVITTGGSTITAIKAAIAVGLIVTMVIVLVDRQEGGREKIMEEYPDIEIVALVLRDEVLTDEQRLKNAIKPATLETQTAHKTGVNEARVREILDGDPGDINNRGISLTGMEP